MDASETASARRGTIPVEGALLGSVAEGVGIPCLVIGGSIHCPRLFSRRLRDHVRLYFVDTRSWVPTEAGYDLRRVTIETYADDLEAARRALGLGPVLVMGHSIHGTQALEYARRYPRSTLGVVAIGAPCGMDAAQAEQFWEMDASAERKALLAAHAPRLAPAALADLDPAAAFIQTYVANGPRYWYDPRYDCSPLWEGVYLNVPQIEHLFGTLFAGYDLAARPGRIEAPVLIALGRYDYVVPYTQWEAGRAVLPDHTYALFERSGHTPPLEEPEHFDRALIAWARRVAGPPA